MPVNLTKKELEIVYEAVMHVKTIYDDDETVYPSVKMQYTKLVKKLKDEARRMIKDGEVKQCLK